MHYVLTVLHQTDQRTPYSSQLSLIGRVAPTIVISTGVRALCGRSGETTALVIVFAFALAFLVVILAE